MYKEKRPNRPKSTLPIQNVIFAPPATIVFWNDGTKSVVKCENEVFDPEKGLAMAIAKRALGNKGNYYETFKKWIDPYIEKEKEKIIMGIFVGIVIAVLAIVFGVIAHETIDY